MIKVRTTPFQRWLLGLYCYFWADHDDEERYLGGGMGDWKCRRCGRIYP